MNTKGPAIEIKSCCEGNQSNVTYEKSNYKSVWKLALSLVLAGQMMVIGLGMNLSMPEYGGLPYKFLHGFLIVGSLVVIWLLGRDLLVASWRNLRKGNVTIEGLFLLSMLGAFVGSLLTTIRGEGAIYYEVVAIVLSIYTMGKLLGDRSRTKALQAVEQLKNEFDYAYVVGGSKGRQKVSIDQLTCCAQVSVGPGEAVSVDGLILQGEGTIKETAMTGELTCVQKKVGDNIWAGSYCVEGVFLIKPLAKKGERKLDAIIKTVEEAQLKPSLLQSQANVIMQWFLPLVVAIAIGTFLYWQYQSTWDKALFNSMSVLLVACPCAIGLATPVAVWSSLWRLSTLGIISRSAEILDILAKATQVVFDKTGTLSEGALVLERFEFFPNNFPQEEELKAMVKYIEAHVDHPLAKAICEMEVSPEYQFLIHSLKVEAGKGIMAEVEILKKKEIVKVFLGDNDWIETITGEKRSVLSDFSKEQVVGVVVNGVLCGRFFLRERMKEYLGEVFAQLDKLDVKTKILTGDRRVKIGELEGVHMEGGLTPEDKVEAIKKYQAAGEKVLFVGDGLNDAAVMAESDGALAINTGPALTQVVAAGVLMGEDMRVIPLAIELCRKMRQKIYTNMLFAAVYNCIGMTLAAMGILHPVVAAGLMLVSSASVSLRAVSK